MKLKDFNKLYLITLLAFCLNFSIANGQDFSSALSKVQEYYTNLESMDACIEVKLYKEKDSKQPFEARNTFYKKYNSNYLIIIPDNTVIYTESYVVNIRESSKQMLISKRQMSENKTFDIINGINTDSLLKAQTTTITFEGNIEGVSHYKLSMKKGIISTIDYYLNNKDNSIKKLTYYYNSSIVSTISRVEITVNTKEINENELKSLFDQNRYFSLKKNVFTPSVSYKNYTIINN